MKVLLASSAEPVKLAIEDVLGSGKNGCTDLRNCPVEQSPERVVQLRPDVVLVDVSGMAEPAWHAILEIQETHPVRVVAVGPSHDAKLILQTLNRGVYRYVDTDQLDDELPQALRRLRAEPPLVVRQGRVIAVLGVCGGCGASTLAVNMAASLGRGQRRSAMVDLDLEGGDLAALLNVQPARSIADLCDGVSRMDTAMFQKGLAVHKSGVGLVAAPQRYQDIVKVTPRGVRKVLSMARSQFDYVVADVCRSFRHEQAQALFQADVVVLVMRPDFTSVRQASRTLAYLEDLGIVRDRVKLVVNRYVHRAGLRPADIEGSLKIGVTMVIPENVRHVSRAVNRGVPLVLDRPRSPVSYLFSELAGSVNGKM